MEQCHRDIQALPCIAAYRCVNCVTYLTSFFLYETPQTTSADAPLDFDVTSKLHLLLVRCRDPVNCDRRAFDEPEIFGVEDRDRTVVAQRSRRCITRAANRHVLPTAPSIHPTSIYERSPTMDTLDILVSATTSYEFAAQRFVAGLPMRPTLHTCLASSSERRS